MTTVQQLIDDLLEIEDKTRPVKTYDADMGDWFGGITAEDYGTFIGIG